jgi:hypothetical protein
MYIERLEGRFPSYLSDDIVTIESAIDLRSEHESYVPFEINLEKNVLTIPSRIYTDSSQLNRLGKLTSKQEEMVHCLYSRHHNGHIRERCLKEFIASDNYFTAPYILQLLGEYVIEIIEIIYINRSKINHDNLVTYILENPVHYEKTKQRVYSYWDAYYRRAFPKYKRDVKPKGECQQDYPGIKMVNYINALLSSNQALTTQASETA